MQEEIKQIYKYIYDKTDGALLIYTMPVSKISNDIIYTKSGTICTVFNTNKDINSIEHITPHIAVSINKSNKNHNLLEIFSIHRGWCMYSKSNNDTEFFIKNIKTLAKKAINDYNMIIDSINIINNKL